MTTKTLICQTCHNARECPYTVEEGPDLVRDETSLIDLLTERRKVKERLEGMRSKLSETKTKSEKKIGRSKLEAVKKKLEEVRAELEKPGVVQENGILQRIKCIQGQSHWTSAEKRKEIEHWKSRLPQNDDESSDST